uniref:Mitochondrial cardiolipin hydrolase n=1 Tax=Cuerna arida TaxID=1464854 RepID=A0A1B6GEV7_9HEMI
MFPALLGKYTSALGVIAAAVPLYYFVRKYLNTDSDDYDDIWPKNEVLFFCDVGLSCKDHSLEGGEKKQCSSKNCSFYNLSRMLHYLNSAESSLDVCLYLITMKDLGSAVIKAQKRGVKVRVICDEDMANGSGSQILSFQGNGLPVKYFRKSTRLMHHKFAIIDKRILMSGSLNWTMQAFFGNWENIIITTERTIVREFLTEFERLWKSLERTI